MIPIIGPILSLISVGVEKYAENKKLKAEGKIALEQAKIRRIENLDAADANWDTFMAKASETSWKDEYWTIVLSIPAILSFIPGMVEYVQQGFVALSAMPEWYQYTLMVAIASAFGFRKITELMNSKR